MGLDNQTQLQQPEQQQQQLHKGQTMTATTVALLTRTTEIEQNWDSSSNSSSWLKLRTTTYHHQQQQQQQLHRYTSNNVANSQRYDKNDNKNKFISPRIEHDNDDDITDNDNDDNINIETETNNGNFNINMSHIYNDILTPQMDDYHHNHHQQRVEAETEIDIEANKLNNELFVEEAELQKDKQIVADTEPNFILNLVKRNNEGPENQSLHEQSEDEEFATRATEARRAAIAMLMRQQRNIVGMQKSIANKYRYVRMAEQQQQQQQWLQQQNPENYDQQYSDELMDMEVQHDDDDDDNINNNINNDRKAVQFTNIETVPASSNIFGDKTAEARPATSLSFFPLKRQVSNSNIAVGNFFRKLNEVGRKYGRSTSAVAGDGGIGNGENNSSSGSCSGSSRAPKRIISTLMHNSCLNNSGSISRSRYRLVRRKSNTS